MTKVNQKQDTVCRYIESIKKGDLKLHDRLSIRAAMTNQHFFIVDEIERDFGSSGSRYYDIYIDDVRMDELLFQLTPSCIIKHAIFEVCTDRELKVLDLNGKVLDCNILFSFENEQLKADEDDYALEHKRHPYSGVKRFGLFALAVAVPTALVVSGVAAKALSALQDDMSMSLFNLD